MVWSHHWYANKRVTCLGGGRVEALVLTSAGALRTHIIYSSSSGEETGQCRSNSFRVVCFKILRWVCPQTHQVAKYVKPLGLMLWVNAPPVIGSRSSGREVCSFVMSPRSGRQQVLDDEALNAAVEEDYSQICGEVAERFEVSDETVRLPLHIVGKAYLSGAPHALLKSKKQQRATNNFLLLSRYHNLTIFFRMLIRHEKWVLYETPKPATGWLPLRNPVLYITILPLHLRKIMLCIKWPIRQVVHSELLPMGQTIIADMTRSNWNVCNRGLNRSQHWLIARVYCSSMIIPRLMWLGDTMPSTLLFTKKLPPPPFLGQSPWEIIRKCGRRAAKHTETFLHRRHCQSFCVAGRTLVNFGCGWGWFWSLTVCHICCIHFFTNKCKTAMTFVVTL